ncbi:MAG: histidine phosphatase family protein [Microthrixaceae bacterium]|nr:histidine phosphatase family protein [Microthrixaceae bacterium]MCO5318225.1 histidine phosphatase family protein [Microthrixaceae bacterium]
MNATVPSTRVLVVRHGQSEWNALGLWQGQEDPPLSDLGRAQAAEASASVGSVDAIVASPLVRASETARIIGEAMGVGPVLEVAGLVERHAGEWQGLTRAQIEQQWPGYLAAGDRPPGWEADAVVEQRAALALEEVSQRFAGGTVLAVAHAGIIYAVERLLGAPFERIANLAGRELEHSGTGLSLGERVHLVAHETTPGQI